MKKTLLLVLGTAFQACLPMQTGSFLTSCSTSSLSSGSFASPTARTAQISTASLVSVVLSPTSAAQSCDCIATAPVVQAVSDEQPGAQQVMLAQAPTDGCYVPYTDMEGQQQAAAPMQSMMSAYSAIPSHYQLAAAPPSTPEQAQMLSQIQQQSALIQQLLQESKSNNRQIQAMQRAADAAERRADDLEDELCAERCSRCAEFMCRNNHYDDDGTYSRKSKEEKDEDAKNCLIACCVTGAIYVLYESGCCGWMYNNCASCCKPGCCKKGDDRKAKKE